MIAAYYRRLTSTDPAVRLAAARVWSCWEAATSYLRPNPSFIKTLDVAERALSFARIECHYFINGGFFNHDGELLDRVDRIRDIPAILVQGRYDVVCPMRSAWDLHKVWPEASLRIINGAGHSSFDPELAAALVEATDSLRLLTDRPR